MLPPPEGEHRAGAGSLSGVLLRWQGDYPWEAASTAAKGKKGTMAYSLRTQKRWAETLTDLEVMFAKWGIREWWTSPRSIDGRKTWFGLDDRKVTISFRLRNGDERSFSMAKQERPQDNLRVLYLALEAIRLNEARGIGEIVREMYAALPAPPKVRDPYEVLGVRPDMPIEDIEMFYRAKAKRLHPDTGGETADAEAFKELTEAYERITGKVPAAV